MTVIESTYQSMRQCLVGSRRYSSICAEGVKDLRRVGTERGEGESFQVSIICHASFLISLPPLTEAGGGLRKVRLPGCCPVVPCWLSSLSFLLAFKVEPNGCIRFWMMSFHQRVQIFNFYYPICLLLSHTGAVRS